MAGAIITPFFPLASSRSSMNDNGNPSLLGKNRGRRSLRPIPTHILTVGKTRSPGVQLIVDEYMNKLQHYCPIDDLRIRPNPKSIRSSNRDFRVQIEHEEAGFMNFIRSDDWVVALDEDGAEMRSEQMADLIGDVAEDASRKRLVFCIGGAYGHGGKLRSRADSTVRLSSMVLNHEIALVVLVEQLYRAWTILHGQNYHH